MSELPRSARIGIGIVTGILGAGLAGGCTAEAIPQSQATEAPQATAVRGDIPLCYPDMPAASVQRKIAESYVDASVSAKNVKPITVRQNPGETAEGYAGKLPKRIAKKVGGAAIKIDFGEYTASGSVVRDPNGKEVVVTAAHVIAPEDITKMSAIKLTDREGNTTGVKSACYVNGTNGKSTPPGDRTGEHVDLAILRPAEDIGSTALTLAKRPPERGELVGFYNFQQNRAIDYPANYSGIALDLRTDAMSNTVITGLGKEDDDVIDNAVMPGASGSTVVDYDTGEVFGVVGSVRRVAFEDMTQFNVAYDHEGASYAGTASVAGIVDVADLEYALASGNY